MTRVLVVSTGGTIASEGQEGGAVPSKRGEGLVASVPELSDYADITVRDVAQRPSFEMDFAVMASMADAVRAADNADGVVVTHGTDTMEESAYYLDLTLDVDTPVVFTGAQRRPDEVSPDGPANMLTAVRAASNDRLRVAGGVYVAFDETLHTARNVTKGHTSRLGTFVSPETGPVASATRDGFRFHRPPGTETPTLPGGVPDAEVRLVTSAAGVDGRPVRRAIADGADGVVLEGTGLGNTTAQLGDAVGEAITAGVPVVVTSRCHAGATRPVYGASGGGETLRQHGVLFGGDLPAHKARIKLALALEETSDHESLREYFTE